MDFLEILGWGEEQINDLRYVGYQYLKQGKYDIAIKFFEALTVLDPENLYDLQTLGALYLEIGKNVEALNYLDRSLKIKPNHFPSLLNRTKALFGLGYKKQGLALAQTLKTCPDKNISSQAEALILAYS
jgi:tetratricopeptide (TPR) repeat protein